MEADIASQAVGLTSSADFSILNLFLRADIIVISNNNANCSINIFLAIIFKI